MKAETDSLAGTLYATFVEASRLRQQALAEGIPRADADALVANALKAAWPKSRELPWRYDCRICRDTGWEACRCTPETPCGRSFKFPDQRPDDYTGQGRCTPGHDYVRSCPSCTKGDARRRGLSRTPKSTDDELAAVGRTRKPTRFGEPR